MEKMSSEESKLINVAHCRNFILRYAQDHRTGWNPNRVSKQFLDDLNIKVRMVITNAIREHPTRGRTVKELQ